MADDDMDFEVISRDVSSDMSSDMSRSTSVFHEPLCLIDSDQSGKLVANESVLDEIGQIDKPLNIVAIAGLYRTGKSYLMNRLAGKNKGFSLGSTIQSMTKGIWVWCGPHPVQPDQVLVLLDTEGLGDVEKGDQNHDSWIFALATLLSSTLVYNTLGALDQDAIEKLNFVTEISKHIKARKDDNNNVDYDMYFPGFVVALRDFTLQLVLNGKEITSDEYLEHCLTCRPEKDEKTKKFNEPRKCIRRYFKERKCFTFDRPAGKKKLARLEELTDDEINEDFLEESAAFCNYIHGHCEAKKLDTGMPVTGRMFVTLVKTYVEAIRNGAVPCIENAINAMAILENTKATEESVRLYQKSMDDLIQMPTERDGVLSDAHHACVNEAVAYFLKKAIYDEGNEFQKKMNEKLKNEFEVIKSKNEEVSAHKCRDVLEVLNLPILEKLKSGAYMCTGGYAIYQQDLHQLQIQYEGQQGLGVKAKDAILTFLHEKWAEGQTILAADQKVSEEEKKVEVERQRAMDAERHREAAERESKLKEEHAKDMERMMKDNIEQLERRREEDLKNMEKHYDDVIGKRMTEQKRTMEEGFKKDADAMRSQIDQLKKEQSGKKKGGGCFADTSLVRVKGQDGKVLLKLLSELNIGDSVESYDFDSGEVVFSAVYFITHSGEGETYGSDLLSLKIGQDDVDHENECNVVRLDANHLLYVSQDDDGVLAGPPEQPIKASDVRIGDILWVRGESGLKPKPVEEIRQVRSGIRHPMTMNHVIIVDGILASVHMHHERLYRVLTSPLRLVYSVSPSAVKSGFVRNAVNAWDYIENFL